jgi:hypothetical protein
MQLGGGVRSRATLPQFASRKKGRTAFFRDKSAETAALAYGTM